LRIERLESRAFQPREIVLHGVADAALQIGEVAVAFRKARKQRRVQRELRRRVDGIDTVLLINVPAQDECPTSLTLVDEVVKRGPSR
jgi:hypothetical protein